uniref:Protein MICROTUBULE BINDING PROTEIN 2C n=1 Tax=Nicotiana tabacum TaxID=4097 RepID=MBP2C_TOBAC|nr:PREDICTED: kinesin-related protein 4-like [Nicotiana tabacum]A0A1S3X835.1 RecName: Full=Protein MICROTUBULE BINDING PROTEIN 2C; Short=NtMBP2C; AltName: Full=Movement protein binding protein 2C; AltName: Full=TMV-MP30 binding protein 2C [Nicotiana tabacum]
MYKPQQQQQLFDLQDNNGAAFDNGGTDPSCWLSHENEISRTDSSLSSSNVDPLLFNDLVQIVPLVQSLIDRKEKSSFTRRGSMTYTKMPSRESLYKKTSEVKGRNAGQSTATKKHRDQNKNVSSSQDGYAENFSTPSSTSSLTEKDREELMTLREKVEDLQKKLLEKDELLKEAEILKNEITATNAELDEMKKDISEKDFLVKTTQVQLSDALVKLADKKAAVEKLEWEAMTSSKKVERLQEDLDLLQGEISSFIQFVHALTGNDSRDSAEECNVIPYPWDQNVEIDKLNERDLQKMEAAREAYIAAVAAAKENPDEASLSAASTARSYLQSLVLRT